MFRSSSAGSKPRCGASRTSITGRRKCGARSCSIRRRTFSSIGNGERQICEIAHRTGGRRSDQRNHRPARHRVRAQDTARRCDRDRLDASRHARTAESAGDPYAMEPDRRMAPRDARDGDQARTPDRGDRRDRRRRRRRARREKVVRFVRRVKNADRERSVIRMPSLRTGLRRPDAYTRMPPASFTSNPTQATRAPWCSATATSMCGSTRHPSRSQHKKWTGYTSSRTQRRPHPFYGDARFPRTR